MITMIVMIVMMISGDGGHIYHCQWLWQKCCDGDLNDKYEDHKDDDGNDCSPWAKEDGHKYDGNNVKVDSCTVELLHLVIIMRMMMLFDSNYNRIQLWDDGIKLDDGNGYGVDKMQFHYWYWTLIEEN